jgi:hypothetical protein
MVEKDLRVWWKYDAVSPYLLKYADELLVALSVDLCEVDVLEVAFLFAVSPSLQAPLHSLRLTSQALERNAHLSIS